MTKPVIPEPKEIATDRHYYDAFGNSETEVSANWIVRYCQSKGNWGSFTYDNINQFYNKDGFWFNRLIDEGWIEKSGAATAVYSVTLAFISRLPRKEL